ncbi:MAG: tetratricopeptide repeat protein [Phycisphaerales bacterium]
MSPEQFQRVDSIFQAARQKPPAEQAAYVTSESAGDAAVEDAVMSLLRHDARADVALDTPALGGAHRLADMLLATEPREVPERIGPYRIIRLIGEGGFGVVYLAEQDQPRRTVALKVLRSLGTPEALRRFEREAAVLARLKHPAVAQIYQAGMTPDEPRQLYFAMEYVPGASLLDYVHRGPGGGGLSIRRRLELAALICDGVEHAHQNGVIHRDLKPDNIIVDERGQPRILDFGVARVVDPGVQRSMQTTVGQIVGTLAYMSPQQVGGDPDRVDTRSDVYSIGVILYQMLSGRLPVDVAGRSLADAARLIQESSPIPLGQLDRALRGDITAISRKALEKDPDRRYQSASQFASDIRALLDDRPVAATNPTTLYELRKLATRHKRLVIVGGMSLALLVAGAAGTAVQAVRATREARRASLQARKLDRINQFFQGMLASAEPNRTRGQQLTVVALLDATSRRIETELVDEPEIRAAVLTTLGDTYANLGAYEQAERHLRGALDLRLGILGAANLDTATTQQSLARVLRDTSRFPEAFDLIASALRTHETITGRDTPACARVLVLYADLLRYTSNDYKAAEDAYREAIRTFDRCDGPRGAQSAAVMGNLGAMLLDFFRFDEAETVLHEAFEIARDNVGMDHSVTIVNGSNYATLLALRNKLAEAREVVEPTMQGARRIYGPDHPETARIEALLAQILFDDGEGGPALPLARHALEVRRDTLPAENRLTLFSMVLLADILSQSGSAESVVEAEALANEAFAAYEKAGAGTYWPCAEARGVLGVCKAVRGEYQSASAELDRSLETIKAGQGKRSRAARAGMRRSIYASESTGHAAQADEMRATLRALDAP